MSSSRVGSRDDTRVIKATRIYSDENGDSRFGSFTITMKSRPGVIGYLSDSVPCKDAIFFRYVPSSYNHSWHNPPHRQLIVNLDGGVEVEVSSGEKRVISAGEVFLEEDVTGKGHRSRAVDNKPRDSILIPVPDDFVAQDC